MEHVACTLVNGAHENPPIQKYKNTEKYKNTKIPEIQCKTHQCMHQQKMNPPTIMGRRIIQLSHDWCDEEAPEVDSSEGTEPHGDEIPMQEEEC